MSGTYPYHRVKSFLEAEREIERVMEGSAPGEVSKEARGWLLNAGFLTRSSDGAFFAECYGADAMLRVVLLRSDLAEDELATAVVNTSGVSPEVLGEVLLHAVAGRRVVEAVATAAMLQGDRCARRVCAWARGEGVEARVCITVRLWGVQREKEWREALERSVERVLSLSEAEQEVFFTLLDDSQDGEEIAIPTLVEMARLVGAQGQGR